MTGFHIGRIADGQWQTLLAYYLDECDLFQLHVPDGEGQLSHGRQEFRFLPTTQVVSWSGMAGFVEISGPLSAPCRQLFSTLEPTLQSYDPEYKLTICPPRRLAVSDYQDLLVWPSARDRAHLDARGVDTAGWQHLEEPRSRWPGRLGVQPGTSDRILLTSDHRTPPIHAGDPPKSSKNHFKSGEGLPCGGLLPVRWGRYSASPERRGSWAPNPCTREDPR